MKLTFKKLHQHAITPAYASDGAGNMDISAIIEEDLHGDKPLVIRPGGQAILRGGLAPQRPRL